MLRALGLRRVGPRIRPQAPALEAHFRRRHKGSTAAPRQPVSRLNVYLGRSAGLLAAPTISNHQSLHGAQSTLAHCNAVSKNPRFQRAVKVLADSVDTRDIDATWQAFMDLRDLERNLGRREVMDEIHRQFPPELLHKVVRALMPEFKPPTAPETIEAAARHVYMFTKLLNYLLLVSKLHKGQRNEIAVLRLTMGQCMRRLIDPKHLRTTSDAKMLVSMWKKISESSSLQLQLTIYEIRMLVLGAWKSGRHLLVPYLYRMACQKWRVGDEEPFQKLSALVLSFYVREYVDSIDPSVVRSLLVDMNQRLVKLSPHHYSMLILYFGKTRNPNEAMNLLEQAMDDPDAQTTEAIYYNAFRAFGSVFALRKRSSTSKYEQELATADSTTGEVQSTIRMPDSDNELAYADELDMESDMLREPIDPATRSEAECLQAAKVCMWLFQKMTSSGVHVSFRTYRELMNCMVQLGMPDKARRIFEFAMESMEGDSVTAHFVAFYLRLIAPTPHQRQLALRGLIRQNENVAMAMTNFSKRQLVDQFGIFDGNLVKFANKELRPALTERGGEFLSHYIYRMYKATRAAAFIECILAGNDPTGRFKGYSFPKAGSGGLGLAVVENEISETCRLIHEKKPRWLQHRDVIYALLPVLPGTAADDANPEPSDVTFIRQLVSGCRDVGQLMTRLDDARVENYDIEMVNQFLRVKFLGLTFQRYVKEKAARIDVRQKRLFWPTFMYVQSNGSIPQDGSGPLASIDRGIYSRDIARMGPDIQASWQHLVDLFCIDPHSRLAINSNTIGIFSRVAIYSEDWEFGQRIWNDVLRLMGCKPGSARDPLLPQTGLPLQSLRVYKNYLQFLALAAANKQSARASPAQRVFNENTLVDMFQLMERNQVGVTSGLLCQGISAAFRIGLIDVGGALEQWQLHRERHGLAEDGFLHQYFASTGLPEVPPEATSVLALVNGTAGCPRLTDFVGRRIHHS